MSDNPFRRIVITRAGIIKNSRRRIIGRLTYHPDKPSGMRFRLWEYAGGSQYNPHSFHRTFKRARHYIGAAKWVTAFAPIDCGIWFCDKTHLEAADL